MKHGQTIDAASIEVGDEISVIYKADGVRYSMTGTVDSIDDRGVYKFYKTADGGIIHQAKVGRNSDVQIVRHSTAIVPHAALF